jgi:phage-related minor tail protein
MPGYDYVIRLTGELDDSKIRQKIRQLQKEAKLNFGTTGAGYGGRGRGNGTTIGGTTGSNGLRSKPRGTGKNTKPFKTYIAGAQQAEKANKRFGASTIDITKKVIQFGATTAVIRGVTSGIGDAVQNVFELDGALTEFKKVSDLSGKGLEDYTDKAFKVGRTVAKTGTEMVQAATEFKKSGFNEKDSIELARVASMYQNVADQELTAGEAANFIVSQMKAYNMTASDSEHIIDAVNEV